MEKVAKRFKVFGKVHGVGFRVFASTCAKALGVCGWVQNMPDGTVESHAEGTEQQLQEYAWDLSRGARYARVERVEETPTEALGLEEFEVRRG